jgi:hypothetical protein
LGNSRNLHVIENRVDLLSNCIFVSIIFKTRSSISEDTKAFLILSTACIAKLFAAPATHVVASLGLLDPELAEWALLEFSPLHKLLEHFICFVRVFRGLVLLTI